MFKLPTNVVSTHLKNISQIGSFEKYYIVKLVSNHLKIEHCLKPAPIHIYIYIDLPVDKSATGLPVYISPDHRWTKSMHGASQKLQIAKESAAIYTDTSVLSSRTPFSQKEIFQAHLSEFCSLKANINIRI